jgi:hypothetical protein
MPEALTLLDAALRGTLLALLLLLAAVLWRDRARERITVAAAALSLGLAVQVIGAMPAVDGSLV